MRQFCINDGRSQWSLAINQVANVPSGGAIYPQVCDDTAAERIGREIETGTVYMNRADYLDPGLAWTGVKDTGRGATLSRVGYESLTRPKSYHLREV